MNLWGFSLRLRRRGQRGDFFFLHIMAAGLRSTPDFFQPYGAFSFYVFQQSAGGREMSV